MHVIFSTLSVASHTNATETKQKRKPIGSHNWNVQGK